MKKITNFVFVVLLSTILIIPSCKQDIVCNVICSAPESIGITSATETIDTGGIPTVLVDFAWDPVPEANTYNLKIYLDGILHEDVNTGADPAYIADLGNIAIDTQIEAEVASNCDCGTSAYSPLFLTIYKNGGGTLDIVLNNSTREEICSSTCEYLRFQDRNFNKCNNTILDLSRENSGFVFYRQDNLCTCLSNYTDSCDAISNLKVCLDSLARAVKTSGNTCP